MRVIAGKYKGRKLETVGDNSVRPATDKVKGAIFNVLQSRVDWTTARVLDLYAGSGGVGIEALSRGARNCIFVEKSRNVLNFLKANIETIGAGNDANVIYGNVETFLESTRTKYTVIFANPPYALEALKLIPNTIFQKDIVAEDGYLIIEHRTRYEFANNGLWDVVVQKTYGNTVVSFFQHKKSIA
ncbi:MAG: 16S rRNA (guanine(966)-N(2))-methyltransferase RsmD [Bacteriovoracaceae bacterium]|nr:16S rRNA (guanine(966)-N(2))-methyltransferase RsmD [Bacteroidota bacterium]